MQTENNKDEISKEIANLYKENKLYNFLKGKFLYILILCLFISLLISLIIINDYYTAAITIFSTCAIFVVALIVQRVMIWKIIYDTNKKVTGIKLKPIRQVWDCVVFIIFD